MIVVEKAEKWKNCNVCHKHNNIYNIIFRYQGMNQGTLVALCDECINELKQKLDHSVRSE